MEITEIRIFPRESKDGKLKAYVSVTFDDSFVIRDIKIIQGNKGYFVAMPSRKVKQSCPKCGHRNVIRSKYCNQCGSSLPLSEPPDSKEIRQREHRDIAHPINSEFRDYLQNEIFKKYEEEIGPLTESKEKQEIAEEEEAQEEVEKEQSESEEESQKQQEKETSKGKQPEGAKQQPKEEESEEDKPRL